MIKEPGYEQARNALATALELAGERRVNTKIGIQNKGGRLTKVSWQLLEDAGLSPSVRREAEREGNRKLVFTPENMRRVRVGFLRNDALVDAVADGLLDFAVTGEEKVVEKTLYDGSKRRINIVGRLGVEKSSLVIASSSIENLRALNGKVVATDLKKTIGKFIAENVPETIIPRYRALGGSEEAAPELGMADAIGVLTATGDTLRANGQRIIATVGDYEAVLAQYVPSERAYGSAEPHH